MSPQAQKQGRLTDNKDSCCSPAGVLFFPPLYLDERIVIETEFVI